MLGDGRVLLHVSTLQMKPRALNTPSNDSVHAYQKGGDQRDKNTWSHRVTVNNDSPVRRNGFKKIQHALKFGISQHINSNLIRGYLGQCCFSSTAISGLCCLHSWDLGSAWTGNVQTVPLAMQIGAFVVSAISDPQLYKKSDPLSKTQVHWAVFFHIAIFNNNPGLEIYI